MIREFCAQSLDPLVGTERFDFIADFGAQMPMNVIGSLLGIPEDGQENDSRSWRCGTPHRSRQADGCTDGLLAGGRLFETYIDWRAKHPSDDIMTELLNGGVRHETGTVRQLRCEEILVILTWWPAQAMKPRPGLSAGVRPRCSPNTPINGAN